MIADGFSETNLASCIPWESVEGTAHAKVTFPNG